MREKETVLDGAKEREIGLQICVNFCENKSQKVIGWNLGQSEKHQASSSSEQKKRVARQPSKLWVYTIRERRNNGKLCV